MLELTVPPTPFIDLKEAKRHLRVEHGDDDLRIVRLIRAAIEEFDGPNGRLLGRCLAPQTWRWTPDACDRAKAPLWLPLRPVIEVVSLETEAEALIGAETYRLLGVNASRGGYLEFLVDSFPSGGSVTFRAGYPTGLIPEPIRFAILLMLGQLYAKGGEDVNASLVEDPAIERLIHRFKVPIV
jgi:uncharacterized phiE125 gp8 family phage protein